MKRRSWNVFVWVFQAFALLVAAGVIAVAVLYEKGIYVNNALNIATLVSVCITAVAEASVIGVDSAL